jgi:putative flippase GtrA
VRVQLKPLSWQKLIDSAIVRWWIVGLFFMGLNIPLLYLFVDGLNFPLWLSTIFASEIGTLLRFLVNDRWVFGHPRPTWQRLWQYHVAIASSFVIWWSVTNALADWLNIHYILASILATCCSVGWSMITNFLWIWRKKTRSPDAEATQRDLTSSKR